MSIPVWASAIGPLVLLAAFALPAFAPVTTPARMTRWAGIAATVAMAAAVLTACAVLLAGPLHTAPLAIDGIGFGLYLDRISATMLCLVSFVGLIVLRYSFTYMTGDPQHVRFIRLLCLTLAAVLTVIVSGNLFQFTLAWTATSIALHRLLVFYPYRPAAVIAARKKFVVSRLGDLCLVAAMVLLFRTVGSLDYARVFSAAEAMRASDTCPPAISAAALLLAAAAMLKSAQFPLHGWLVEVMETPTPVSALLHAGIINAGGFLVLRFADIVALSPAALDTLAVLGGFTALFGSVVMLTQTSIKGSLAFSTIAQMGFMMLECGLGAFSAALLHIVAHSLYKAHAFLASGSVIDIARASWTPSPGGRPHPFRLLFSIAGVLAITFAFSLATGATLTHEPGVFALGAVLLLGLIHLVANGIDERPDAYVVGRTLALAGLVAGTYFALQLLAERLLAGALPPAQAQRGPFDIALVGLVVLSFAAVTFLQGQAASHAVKPRWQALYVHVFNGFYVNTIANRLVLRCWPGPPPVASVPDLPLAAGAHG